MNLLKLGFYGMILGLVFGSTILTTMIQLPFLVAHILHQASVNKIGIIAGFFIVELLATASLLWICVEIRNDFSTFLQSKLNLQEDLYSLNEKLVKACGVLAGLNLVFQIHLLFDVV